MDDRLGIDGRHATLNQTAVGGNGGVGTGGAGGSGGVATSTLTFTRASGTTTTGDDGRNRWQRSQCQPRRSAGNRCQLDVFAVADGSCRRHLDGECHRRQWRVDRGWQFRPQAATAERQLPQQWPPQPALAQLRPRRWPLVATAATPAPARAALGGNTTATATSVGNGAANATATADGGNGSLRSTFGSGAATASSTGTSGNSAANALSAGGMLINLESHATAPVSGLSRASARAGHRNTAMDAASATGLEAAAFTTGLPTDAQALSLFAGNGNVEEQFNIASRRCCRATSDFLDW